jgi:hypothetical protein
MSPTTTNTVGSLPSSQANLSVSTHTVNSVLSPSQGNQSALSSTGFNSFSAQTFNSSLAQDLSTLLSSRLPPIDIDKFNGDYKRYETFKTRFQTLIACTNTSAKDQAKTLYQSLVEDVVEQLDHVPNLDSADAYEKLWQSLDSEYGRFQNGVIAYVTELTTGLQSWPTCKTSTDLHQLYKFVRSHYTALEQVGQESQAEHTSIRMLLLGRFTGRVMGRCSTVIDENPNSPVIKRILEIMKKEQRNLQLQEMSKGIEKNPAKPNTIPLKSNLVNTIEENVETTRVNNVINRSPHSPKLSPSSNNGHSAVPQQSPAVQPAFFSRGGFYAERQERFSHKCIFCLSEEHDSDGCKRFSNPNEYKGILYRYRLCFNCKGQDHRNYQCNQPKLCTKNCTDSSKHCTIACTHHN